MTTSEHAPDVERLRAIATAAAENWRIPSNADGTGDMVKPRDHCIFGYEEGYFDALSAVPTPKIEAEERRQAIARIIDPVAFSDRYIGNRTLVDGGALLARRAIRRATALATADAILALSPAPDADAQRTIEILRRALAWHGDPQRMATTREEWQQEIDAAIHWVKANPEPDRPSFSSFANAARAPDTVMVPSGCTCSVAFGQDRDCPSHGAGTTWRAENPEADMREAPAGTSQVKPAPLPAPEPGEVTQALTYGHMPSYGRADFRHLREAVAEANRGVRQDDGLPDSLYPGHHMVSGINYNSLSRIVTAFVDASQSPALPAQEGVE